MIGNNQTDFDGVIVLAYGVNNVEARCDSCATSDETQFCARHVAQGWVFCDVPVTLSQVVDSSCRSKNLNFVPNLQRVQVFGHLAAIRILFIWFQVKFDNEIKRSRLMVVRDGCVASLQFLSFIRTFRIANELDMLANRKS